MQLLVLATVGRALAPLVGPHLTTQTRGTCIHALQAHLNRAGMGVIGGQRNCAALYIICATTLDDNAWPAQPQT